MPLWAGGRAGGVCGAVTGAELGEAGRVAPV
jgi:hypothetical protein